jgi:aubergine
MPVTLSTNYFKLQHVPSFFLSQYRVDFEPDIDLTQKRKQLLGLNKQNFGGRYVFDGASLYLAQNLPDFSFTTGEFDGKIFTIYIRQTGLVDSSDPQAFQIYNLIFREAMSCLKLQNVKRDYFDPYAKVRLTLTASQALD